MSNQTPKLRYAVAGNVWDAYERKAYPVNVLCLFHQDGLVNGTSACYYPDKDLVSDEPIDAKTPYVPVNIRYGVFNTPLGDYTCPSFPTDKYLVMELTDKEMEKYLRKPDVNNYSRITVMAIDGILNYMVEFDPIRDIQKFSPIEFATKIDDDESLLFDFAPKLYVDGKLVE